MREIKFRAWDERHGVMHHNVQFIKSGDTGADWICFDSDEKPSRRSATGILFDDPFFSQQIKLMQYTGLKDSTKWEQLTAAEQMAWLDQGKTPGEWHGKEIYEGDIFDFIGINGTYTKGKVIFHNGRFAIKQIGAEGLMNDLYKHSYYAKVIDNIYENPELLK